MDIKEAAPRDRTGFGRSEMDSEKLAGTVKLHQTHLFLCCAERATAWATKSEEVAGSAHAELSAAVQARKDVLGAAKVTLYESCESATDAPGDVLCFPSNGAAFRIRAATNAGADAPAWAAEVAAAVSSPPAERGPEAETAFVFVCAHAKRDKRCGHTGPLLLAQLRTELASLPQRVAVHAVSHVGGHAYAGNVLVFAPRDGKEDARDWYGYVRPDDVPLLVRRIREGVNDAVLWRRWRGAQGMEAEECVACAACHLTEAEGSGKAGGAVPSSSCALS